MGILASDEFDKLRYLFQLLALNSNTFFLLVQQFFYFYSCFVQAVKFSSANLSQMVSGEDVGTACRFSSNSACPLTPLKVQWISGVFLIAAVVRRSTGPGAWISRSKPTDSAANKARRLCRDKRHPLLQVAHFFVLQEWRFNQLT